MKSRREQFIAYTEMLRERFHRGVLAELQPLNQWVVWRGEIEDGKKKKVPYNPNHNHISREQASKFRKVGEHLTRH